MSVPSIKKSDYALVCKYISNLTDTDEKRICMTCGKRLRPIRAGLDNTKATEEWKNGDTRRTHRKKDCEIEYPNEDWEMQYWETKKNPKWFEDWKDNNGFKWYCMTTAGL